MLVKNIKVSVSYSEETAFTVEVESRPEWTIPLEERRCMDSADVVVRNLPSVASCLYVAGEVSRLFYNLDSVVKNTE